MFSAYVKGNFHVALMVLCCYELTHLQWGISASASMRFLIFCLAFLGYTGIKNVAFIQKNKRLPRGYLFYKFLLIIAFLWSGINFLRLSYSEQCLLITVFLFCVAYAVPLLKTKKNLRNQFGVKIFIVAICWTLLTAVFPLLHTGQFNENHFLFFGERYLMIFMATLPFEIADLKKDDLALGTIPQRIGLLNTRILGIVLILLLLFIIYLNEKHTSAEGLAFLGMAMAYAITFFKIESSSSEFISLFWVEAIPLLGLILFQF